MIRNLSAKKQAILEVTTTAVIWGFAFIVVVWCLKAFSPAWLVGIRFFIALIALVAVRIVVTGFDLTWARAKKVFLPGLFLFLVLFLQTIGLKYTTPTKSGFITTLYVLFIPIFDYFYSGRRVDRVTWIWIFVALVGTGFMCQIDPLNLLGTANFGDFITFICAIMGAAHLIASVHSLKSVSDSIEFSIYQSFWVFVLGLGAAIVFEPSGIAESKLFFSSAMHDELFQVTAGMIYLGVVSSALSFLLIVRAQKVLPPTPVGLLCLLESPFAAMFSFFLMAEILNPVQWLGAAVILISAGVVSVRTGN